MARGAPRPQHRTGRQRDAGGRKAVYVDYVDYDGVAHHVGSCNRSPGGAGGARLDATLAQLERVAEAAPRRYHFVVLSDHGQSQGEIFADRFGEDLVALVLAGSRRPLSVWRPPG